MNPSKVLIGNLQRAQVAIDNALGDPQILAVMETHGYTVEKMLDGKTMVATVQQYSQQQQADYGAQFSATDELNLAKEAADNKFTRYRDIAKVIFRDDRAAQQTLGIAGQYPVTYPLWLDRNKQFYANALANPSLLTALTANGVTQAQLEEAQELVTGVETAYKLRQQKTGSAQQSTHKKNQANKAFSKWTRDFYAIARIAMADEPQLLEKLGLSE